jgi:hypothetical protein
MLVDNLNKVHEILSEIRKVQNVPSTGFEDLGFVLKWAGLSSAEKDQKYSDYFCHELNFFIAKRDPAYFTQVVQPFLETKMEKQFMDHYLLGHFDKCLAYACP